MGGIQDRNVVRKQYKNSDNLERRISIHEKYGVNKKGFGNWIYEQYKINENDNVLELGCGNGDMWREHINLMPRGSSLMLTDFSEGMLRKAQININSTKNVYFKEVDIQKIPFGDDSFDIVIANMMLHHVPDLNRALMEAKRVLKPGGTFYCATYGEHGIVEYIQELLVGYVTKTESNEAFTLQNGEEMLLNYFSDIERTIYEDHLEVTNTEDLIDYVSSLSSMADFNKISKEELGRILDSKKVDGKIIVPKEYGMFIAKK